MGDNASYKGLMALIANGDGVKRASVARFEWDISNECEAPVRFQLTAHPEQLTTRGVADLSPYIQARIPEAIESLDLHNAHWQYDPGHSHPLMLDMEVRCRKCAACLRRRARLWAHKAQLEIASASRTWFATFTGNPDEQFRWLSLARMNRLNKSSDFDAATPNKEFGDIVAAAGPDITRYVKRIRKESGALIRYLIVAERHKSGQPHWHALIHEVDPARPIRKAVLKGQWPHGFTQFKLVENSGAAWYLCKYLSKDLATRVRASLRYGTDPKTTLVDRSLSDREEITTPKPLRGIRPVNSSELEVIT